MSEEKRTAEQVSEEQVMELQIEGLTEEEVKEIQKIFQRFVNKYKENPERETREWLYEQGSLRAEIHRIIKTKPREA